jgi:hypothetical protein
MSADDGHGQAMKSCLDKDPALADGPSVSENKRLRSWRFQSVVERVEGELISITLTDAEGNHWTGELQIRFRQPSKFAPGDVLTGTLTEETHGWRVLIDARPHPFLTVNEWLPIQERLRKKTLIEFE